MFRDAARHSRRVRLLRVAIPAVIVVIAAVIFGATFFNPFKLIRPFPIDIRKVTLSDTKLIMESPRVTGFTTDSRPYEMVARAAAQDLTKPDILELKDIDAKVEMRNGQHVTIKSINGIYDTKGEVLKLKDHITLKSTSGYEGRLSEATVHTSSGRVVSESPVEVQLPNGVLNANRLEVTDNGASIVFGGGVEMHINPEQVRPAPQDAATVGGAPVQTTARSTWSP